MPRLRPKNSGSRAFCPATICRQKSSATGASERARMDYVRFGKTGLEVSRLCLGTMSMGRSAWKAWVLDENASIPILRHALDLGINFFDMADWYSSGHNEEVVGRNLLKMST